VPIVLKSGSLSLLDPSGPVQVCNGIALPLPYLYFHIEILSFEKGPVDFIGLSKGSMAQEKIKEPLP
jgi:hypothetical protein